MGRSAQRGILEIYLERTVMYKEYENNPNICYAVDDVITTIEISLGTNSEVNLRPADGVEWIITQAWPSNSSNSDDTGFWAVAADASITFGLKAGETSAGAAGVSISYVSGAIFLTYSNYTSLRNSNAGTKVVGYHGLQTK